jgi:hypothetical protein
VGNRVKEQFAEKTVTMTMKQLQAVMDEVGRQAVTKAQLKKALASGKEKDGTTDIDAVLKKATLTLIGELYSLISGTPDEELEAMMVQSLYGMITALVEPDAIMKVADIFLKAKRERIEGLVSALAELCRASP